tara:strand:- start:386 stop:976 length:591 start_codon:yes stop_codon:yes gene_type:complete
MKLQNAFTLVLIIFMFILPFSYAHANKSQEYKYQDWIVDSEGPSVRFYTKADNKPVRFGWVKPFGYCAHSYLLMDTASYMVQKDYIDQFEGKVIPLEVFFPKIHAQKEIILKAEIVNSFAVNPAWTITRIGLAQAGKRMNYYMEELDKVVIQMPEDPNHLFEYKLGEFSLKGYKAAKTKAAEICHNNSISLIVLNH